MGWFRKLSGETPPHRLTRGDDVAIVAPAGLAARLQVELGRAGTASRAFNDPEGLVRTLGVHAPRAVLIAASDTFDWRQLTAAVRDCTWLGDVKVVVASEQLSDAELAATGAHVACSGPIESWIEALAP